MSLNIEGSSCARCKAYLFSEDDVVYCPECGAPHHRDCYSALGHCALEELHGTPQQYSREKEIEAKNKIAEKEKQEEKEREQARKAEEGFKTCVMCGERYDFTSHRCPKCGAPDVSRISGFEGFDFLGGVPADYVIDENVTADDAKRFVATNTHRYVPKFATLNKTNKISWNWMAFLFPCSWMLSRKMFKGGIVAGILSIITSLFSYPLSLALYNQGLIGTPASPELIKNFSEALPQIGGAVILCAMAGLILELVLRLVFGMFGDYFYRNYAVEQIKRIKAESIDPDEEYRKKGGANLFLFLLGLLAVEYLPSFIVMLF